MAVGEGKFYASLTSSCICILSLCSALLCFANKIHQLLFAAAAVALSGLEHCVISEENISLPNLCLIWLLAELVDAHLG